MKRIVLLALSCLWVGIASATLYTVTSQSRFNSLLSTKDLAVVMFYYNDVDTRDNPQLQADIEEMENAFESASRTERSVSFIKINLSKNGLADLKEEYQISKVPIFMLFRNGVAYSERGRSPGGMFSKASGQQAATLKGFAKRAEILSFIRTYFDDYVEEAQQQKKEDAADRRDRRSDRKVVVTPWYNPYWYGYGYPYGWYGGYGWYGHRGWYGHHW